jgi:outer membrane immunogenic protein
MRILLAATLGSVALIAGLGAASAADLPVKAVPKAVPFVAPYSWTGFYAGVNLGGISATNSDGASGGGVLGGGQLGYNFQSGNIVFGLETDIQATSVRGSNTVTIGGATLSETLRQPYFGTVRGRIGWTWDRWLAYVTGGYAYTSITHDGTATGTVTGTYSAINFKSGATIGGGLEWAAGDRWSVKGEYLYLSFNGNTNVYTTTTPPVSITYGRPSEHVFRAGINYHF